MSRKSKRLQSTSSSQKNNTLSQHLSQSQRNSTLTQQTLEESFGGLNINVDDQVNNLVRYIVNRAGSHLTFKQSELKKNVLKAGHRYQEIIEKVTNILKNVYGYNMIVSDPSSNSSREYIISNALPYIDNPVVRNEDLPGDAHKVLLLLILSHIFMSNSVVSDVSLYAFLKSLNIDTERRHDIFGNVKDYIHHSLKNKKYLNIEMDQISKKVSFSWGTRAEKEISKHEILKFVCKMYNDRLPNSWINQFKVAEEQGYENDKEIIE
ncbi:non-structural maintenance of chromosomes element 3 homolog [Anoplophora glabripennis]|uniref:non-structural maintenance of chromosomes element 3 homolog n=1 Tax=Anoplophora glabripennis TaxID=217634 RepID=UPI000873ED1A|nr:non-structural maintenance of chromosomes element 3 homolog [Anoplophora glabripennis]